MAEKFLMLIIFIALFTGIEGIVLAVSHRDLLSEAKEAVKSLRKRKGVAAFLKKKAVSLRKMGADIYLRDQMTVSEWYLYKILFGSGAYLIARLITKVTGARSGLLIPGLAFLIGFFFFDLYLRLQNKSANEKMMPDICEMSRSVLYGKRGGQFISDALSDSVMVVEDKRLKMALIRLRNSLSGGMALEDALNEFELSFDNAEISAFCTVIKSLQSTGQVDESLKTLENNIEREQVSVNRRKNVILENKTMAYVLLIAFDILAVILYCVIEKLLQMEIAF